MQLTKALRLLVRQRNLSNTDIGTSGESTVRSESVDAIEPVSAISSILTSALLNFRTIGTSGGKSMRPDEDWKNARIQEEGVAARWLLIDI